MIDIRKLLQLNMDELEGLDISNEEAVAALRESAAQHRLAAKEMRKVFLLTGIIVLSLAVVFFGILAWFTNSKKVSGKGITINVFDNKISVSDYDVYYCTKSLDGTVTTYNRGLYTDNISMPDYDMAIGYDTDNTSAVLRIPIERVLEFDSSKQKIVVNVARYDGATWHTISGSGTNYMSSILQVRCATVPALQGTTEEVPATNKQEIYTKSTAEFNKLDSSGAFVHTPYTFVDKTNPATSTYAKTLSFEITDNFAVYPTAEGHYRTYVYVQYDYCTELVRKFYEMDASGYGDIGGNAYKTSFFYDEALITISIVDK